jgi:hypothetical protein
LATKNRIWYSCFVVCDCELSTFKRARSKNCEIQQRMGWSNQSDMLWVEGRVKLKMISGIMGFHVILGVFFLLDWNFVLLIFVIENVIFVGVKNLLLLSFL